MSLFGASPITPTTGIQQAARSGERKKQAQQATRSRATDEVEVQNSQSTDAVRGLTGNADEEAAADHHRQGDPQKQQPRLDIKG